MIAVTMPTGNCWGAMMVLARASAITKKLPPSNMEQGSSKRWSRAPHSLNMWGMIKPTKPTEPAMVTAVAVSNDADR